MERLDLIDATSAFRLYESYGLPYEVIQRAEEIQSILEKDDEMMRKIKAKKLEEQRSLDRF